MLAQTLQTMNVDLEVFEYPAVAAPPLPSWEAFGSAGICVCAANRQGEISVEATGEHQALDGKATSEAHSEELRRRFEAGRDQGIAEGRAAERQASAALVTAEETRRVEQVAHLADSFNGERTSYFESAEREVVKLALSVAARILRREAQMDPLLLSGAVRVALGQLSASTQVRLRVPASDLDLWRDTIAHLPNLAVKPAVVADGDMRLGDCMLETELGSVDLGIRSQLAEIERGFFDSAGGDRPATEALKVTEEMSE